ncbi:spermidine synthase [Arthrobacter russicus]|uniref:spermidine synthase n=1 Tax=Arthrobacter russicus TaxID=172040 RepID=UPI00286B3A5C|nr:fused MFS/spermidine synthase [Arthrobacter russicus]
MVPGAFVLEIAGAAQSHVDLAHPEQIFYEYLRRIGNLLDVFRPAAEPVRALHLGAGALTLVRYLAVRRPGSEQTAVELERELLDFVLNSLPLPPGTRLRNIIGDARWSLPEAARTGPFDAIVLDIFSGPQAPEHIASVDFYTEAARLLTPDGVLIVNVGDEAALTLVRSQCAALRSVLPATVLWAESGMFSGRYPGNMILAGVKAHAWPPDWTEQLLALGPHPSRLLSGLELDEFSR